MPHRVIAKLSAAIASIEDARAFVDSYNRSARGCHSAEMDPGEDDRLPFVPMLEHDTEAQAIAARLAASGLYLCEWCGDREATVDDGLCEHCWDERERMKAEGEGG
ncbi:MAG: hypothetical protein V3V34_11695 [Kiloniellales bacterium]